MHGKPRTEAAGPAQSLGSQALTDWALWVKKLLPADKWRVAMSLIRTPLPTVALVGESMEKLARCFDGVDRDIRFTFTTDELSRDYDEYREMLGGEDAWRVRGMDNLRCRFNGIAIADLPAEQTTNRPEPYYYVRDLDTIHAYLPKDDATMEYVILKESPKEKGLPEKDSSGQDYELVTVFDDEAYKVFRYYGKSGANDRLQEQSISPHGLGVCPARFFWTDSIDGAEPELKNHPITPFLGELDILLFKQVLKEYADLYGGFPITSTYKSACNFKAKDSKCEGGWLASTLEGTRGQFLLDGDGFKSCPDCKDRNNVGPGTHFNVPLPKHQGSSFSPDLMPGVNVTAVDASSLEYNSKQVVEYRSRIYAGLIGSAYDDMGREAMNEDQINAILAAQRQTLRRISRNFENFQHWVESTMCKLRYGSSFIEAVVNFGTDWFILSSTELQDMYNDAREKKMGVETLDFIQSLHINTRFRRQPIQMERAKILMALDPARHLTPEQTADLLERDLITREDYGVKCNLASLVDQFELENGQITTFGEALEWEVKIERIKEALRGYIPELQEQEPGQPGEQNVISLPGAAA